MKNILLAVSLFALCWLVGCTKGGEPVSVSGNTYTVASSLNGSNVFPATANDTTSGTVNGWYDEEANVFTFTMSYKKDTTLYKQDTLTGIQLYKGSPAVSGNTAVRNLPVSILINAATKPNPTNIAGSMVMGISGYTGFSTEEKDSFLAGSWYAVLQSKKFPKGVIGGQLSVNKR